MNYLKDFKNRENILNGIVVVSLLMLGFLSYFVKNSGIYAFISFTIVVFTSYILIPLNEDYGEGDSKARFIGLKLLLRFIVSIVFLISIYMIFLQKNYNLKYTYYITIVGIVLIAGQISYKSIRSEYQKRVKKENGKYRNANLIIVILYTVWLFGFFFYIGFDRLIIPPRELVLEQLKSPESITVYKMDDDFYEEDLEDMSNNAWKDIDDPELIEKIVNELNTQKIENLTGTDIINYERMIDHNKEDYTLYFNYAENGSGDDMIQRRYKDRLKKGYVDSLVITYNGAVFMEDGMTKDAIIFYESHYMDIFSIELSQELIKMIKEIY
nr:hypothetical protein [Tissierella sp.]